MLLPLRCNYEGLADSYGGADSFLVTTETPVEQDFDTLCDDLLDRLGELINSAPFHNEMRLFLSEPEIAGTFGRDGFLRVLERDVRLRIERGTGVTG